MSGLVRLPKIGLLVTVFLALVLSASQAVAEQRPFNLGQTCYRRTGRWMGY